MGLQVGRPTRLNAEEAEELEGQWRDFGAPNDHFTAAQKDINEAHESHLSRSHIYLQADAL